ncbi:sugar porter family MFS transporter [Pontibacter sp. SGAir0037]|uniref:sugar porter family MFS transporter n=1 Tax=Pontibacter sp. SGAir0037 TaxID=2571030 RepID=UPI0010CCBC4F|nr:sugar porter family MFS transporter [Pontibacter sp. SGAir0037]QCR24973.1 MFS transporter [Pontibacter sp. SGAir0037]
MHQNRSFFLFAITIVATMGGLLFGFDMAVISGVLPFVKEQFLLSAAEEGWFVSSALVGAIGGVGFSGELSDRWGRKNLLLLAAILFLVSAVGTAGAPSFIVLVIARMLGGIGVGVASIVAPLYISEIAPAAVRGRLVTFYQLAITLGIVVAYLTNAGLLNISLAGGESSRSEGLFEYLVMDEVWRSMFGLEALPAVLFLIGLLFVPESPRWLIQKGRVAEGIGILSRISSRPEAEKDALSIQHTLKQETGSYKELFAPGMRKALWIGLLLPLFSQFSGVNAVIYYGPRILNDAGIDMSNALMGQVIFGLANFLFTLIAVWKVDKLGRRPLYLIGSAGATVSLFLTGYSFYSGGSNLLLLVSIIVFLACFAFSIGPLKFVVAAEIFPNKVRGRALALSIMVMWVADTIVGQITPIFLASYGAAVTFWFFAAFCLIAFWVVYKMVPETKGKTLEEIQNMWATPSKEKSSG